MKRLGSDLKFCSCRMCRYGLRTESNSKFVRYLRRANRHKVKQMLKQGFYDIPEKVWVPYTD